LLDEHLPLADDLLKYLGARPGAGDTLEGITRWWWERQAYEDARSKIRDALSALVALGKLNVRELPGGDRLFLVAAEPEEKATN
jgi:hypothetical protein